MIRTLVHLVRHAEVFNPDNIWYGRLEGFVLSERGLRQSERLGEYFSDREVAAVYSSPLVRAIQTAEAICKPHDLSPQVEPDIMESTAKLQGNPGDKRLFRNPLNLRYFLNPLQPSWGEPYASTRERTHRAVHRMVEQHSGGEVVAVSHMTPILVCRLGIERNPRPPWLAKVPCARASVTTLEFNDGTYVATEYEPVGSEVG